MEKTAKQKSKNKNITRIIFITILVIGSVIGIIKYRDAQRYETTDDAQLETDITPVSARVTGYISQVFISENQKVKKGDTIVILDNRDLKNKLEQAEAALENVKASLETARANATSVQVGGGTSVFKTDELQIRIANAQKEFDRYKKLLSDGAVTQQQFDKVATDKDALEKQMESAQQQSKEASSKTTTAQEQIKVAESVVKQRQSELNYAELQLSYAVVIAPFDGIVSKKNAVAGQLIQAGQPLCSIVAEENVWIIANFKETQIAKMKQGMKVEIDVDAFPDKKITGKLSSFASATGSRFSLIPPDNASGNYVKVVQRIPVKIELDKSNDAYKDLRPGMSVFVKVVLDEK